MSRQNMGIELMSREAFGNAGNVLEAEPGGRSRLPPLLDLAVPGGEGAGPGAAARPARTSPMDSCMPLISSCTLWIDGLSMSEVDMGKAVSATLKPNGDSRDSCARIAFKRRFALRSVSLSLFIFAISACSLFSLWRYSSLACFSLLAS
eukprot:CAMPEP_0168496454 /NCGR_PEP_ID=MMETSP0228-20121227/72269_1 /TAXON_ID=133427 /ORGANISM="Protoceratium reticulatum, Strain CCCM 535 (=CCMP 1889)" /LENGTH=148 /DNA_ID=CAMNT_0008513321 /DNA_START=111 /DNA_END=553 /DNA_ORIENTATION=-